MQDNLHIILPRRNIAQAAHRVPKGRFADHNRLAGTHRVHIHPKHHLGAWGIVDLEARLGGRISGENQKQPAVNGLGSPSLAESYGKARPGLSSRQT
jgi:hypothetical protein